MSTGGKGLIKRTCIWEINNGKKLHKKVKGKRDLGKHKEISNTHWCHYNYPFLSAFLDNILQVYVVQTTPSTYTFIKDIKRALIIATRNTYLFYKTVNRFIDSWNVKNLTSNITVFVSDKYINLSKGENSCLLVYFFLSDCNLPSTLKIWLTLLVTKLSDWLFDVLCCFQHFSVILQHFLGKLPVLLVQLFWHQPVSWNTNPATPSAAFTTILKFLVWPSRGSNLPAPEANVTPLHHPGCVTKLRHIIHFRYFYLFFYLIWAIWSDQTF